MNLGRSYMEMVKHRFSQELYSIQYSRLKLSLITSVFLFSSHQLTDLMESCVNIPRKLALFWTLACCLRRVNAGFKKYCDVGLRCCNVLIGIRMHKSRLWTRLKTRPKPWCVFYHDWGAPLKGVSALSLIPWCGMSTWGWI